MDDFKYLDLDEEFFDNHFNEWKERRREELENEAKKLMWP